MEHHDWPLLIWWADLVAMLSLLSRRQKAQVLGVLADEVRDVLATEPDKEIVPAWLINLMFGWEVFPVPRREWDAPVFDPVVGRIIG